ncbi:tetratricopeptide repeat protein [Treponema sp.]|uniref:tetratricopeptide repeat protein n=1 Tax=Treponema sp. TaxID=166 RepID=UPI00298DA235|nr:tetratricopeptide repeat protein [Treponema sp.]MCQ2241103.1 tetratricopeptide repeat protein [Treponema sp.]
MKKNNMKKSIATVSALVLASFFCFAAPADSATGDSWIFSEIVTAYSGAAYPSVIEHADKLVSNYPDSIYYHKALLYKGESLCSLGRYSDAEPVLSRACDSDDVDVQVLSFYWLGRTRLAMNKNKEAVEAFYRCCEISSSKKISKKSEHYYNMALFYAGKTYFISEDYNKSIPVFESVISRGDSYPVAAYSDSFVMLFESYLEENKYSSLISLYKKTPEMKGQPLSNLYAELSLLASTAYEKTGDYKNAWACCIKALSSTDESVSTEAFRTAYRISGPYEKQTGKSSASVFEAISDMFAADPDLLAEFWTRVATDCFENGDYENASTYFNKAEKYDQKKKYASLISLYRARLKGNTLELVGTVDDSNELYADYEAAFAEQYASIGDWTNCHNHGKNAYDKITSSDDVNLRRKSAYYYAMGLLNCGKISEAENVLENGKVSFKKDEPFYDGKQKILARCYALSGREETAIKIYSLLNLNGEEKADYAKVLFSCGYLSASKDMGLKSDTSDGKYIAALSSFNLKQWKDAEYLFGEYLRTNAKVNREYAVFYLGYCQYKLGKPSASDTLEKFSVNYKGHALCYNAAIICANSLIASEDFKRALNQSSLAINLARNSTERENATLLTSSIYADSGDLDRAIAVLSPYLKESSEFGIFCRYESALLYARAGKINESDRYFNEIYAKYPSSKYAEESAYRRAELYYSNEKYQTAITRFDEYKKSFPKGNFYESAIFYSADCQRKTGNSRGAILSYELLLVEYPKSTYAYVASRNLVQLYRDAGNYSKAMESCKKMLASALNEDQKKEAKKEEENLSLMVDSGNDPETMLKKKYESLGKHKSVDGRIAGTELAEFIWNKEKYSDEAVAIAEKIYSEQIKKSNVEAECAYAAKNGIILAESERHDREYLSSAELFLAAAKYARMANKEILASRALYGAAEAFDTAGKKGDAKSVAENLIELYPNTEYAKSVRELIKR